MLCINTKNLEKTHMHVHSDRHAQMEMFMHILYTLVFVYFIFFNALDAQLLTFVKPRN